ncbi:MAG TPA: TetR family transcriptional regulator [Rhizomicrobium sp.]|nr:TetR family transcriptional regulator [Rhizomicrobium sp.]
MGRAESIKAAARPSWVSQRDRSATREALIEVARLMVERDGEPALTLGAVADEAGLARATVYGFFSGRGELLDAIDPRGPQAPPASTPEAGEDETEIWANCQPDLSAFVPDPEPEVEPEPEPAPEPESVAEAPVEEEAPVALPEEPAAEIETSEQDDPRKLQAAHLEEIAKRLILPESALKQGTDAVIARLDTRIRVLEKSIAGLETRQTATETDAPKRLKPVIDRLDRLDARMDGADAKALQTVSELRLSLHQLESRVGALEGPDKVVAAPEPWTPEPELEAVEAAPEDETAEPAQDDNPRHAYLSNVRTLAKEGARAAEERESAEEAERLSRRRRMAVAASVAVLCLGAIGALYVFNPGTHGVTMARSKPAPAPVAVAHAAQSPLDRLSALAMKGDADAELLVGLKYLEHNDKLAADWLTRAAAQNNALAENALGALYQSGRGVKADSGAAARLYQASAAQGNRHAMSNLAVLHAGGDGRTANFAEAARWFQRAASLGYVDAEFNLAVLYERGDGVPQSLLEAYKWYAIAATAGDAVAKTRADAIATQLTPDELQAAQRAALEFKPAPLNAAANDVPALATVLASR